MTVRGAERMTQEAGRLKQEMQAIRDRISEIEAEWEEYK